MGLKQGMGRGVVWILVTVITAAGVAAVAAADQETAESSSCLAAVDYADALGKAILFFEGQRSGKLPSGQRVTWRGDSAPSDGNLDNVNLAGGYYDAGDNVKFVWPMSFSITLLSWTAVEYGTQISSAGQLGYLRSAIRWGSDFILRAHTSPTTLYTQVGDGNSDHQCWERPEDMDTPRTLYKITAASPGTEAAADAAAALASASLVFKGVDSNYSSQLLAKSRSLFGFADKYRGSYQGSCPFYCSYSGYQDELLWAAAWLYKATKSSTYLKFLSDNQGWSRGVPEFSWDNKFPGVQALLAKEYVKGTRDFAKYKSDVDSFVCSLMPRSGTVQTRTTPGGLLFTRDSSNIQYVAGAALILFLHSNTTQMSETGNVQCGSVKIPPSELRAFAKSQVDYILGKNPANMSYMVGHGAKYPLQLHHRGASIPSIRDLPAKVDCKDGFSTWFSAGKPNPNIHIGAVVGGPNANDDFQDIRSDSPHLEPATYMNAAFLGAVAPLLTQQSCVH